MGPNSCLSSVFARQLSIYITSTGAFLEAQMLKKLIFFLSQSATPRKAAVQLIEAKFLVPRNRRIDNLFFSKIKAGIFDSSSKSWFIIFKTNFDSKKGFRSSTWKSKYSSFSNELLLSLGKSLLINHNYSTYINNLQYYKKITKNYLTYGNKRCIIKKHVDLR